MPKKQATTGDIEAKNVAVAKEINVGGDWNMS